MAITANRELNRYVDQELRSFEVLASEHIYKGALVGLDRSTGYVRNLEAGDSFAGIAYEEIDNSGGANGDLSVRVYTQGDFILPVSGAARVLIGSPAWAADNESTSVFPQIQSSYVGSLIAVVGTNLGIVRIRPFETAGNEKSVAIDLNSSTSQANLHTVMITQRPTRIHSVEVRFATVPDAGALDIGVNPSDPDAIINNFNLATLSPATNENLTISDRDQPADVRILARVGQASSTAGVDGVLMIRYFELP